jgi:endoglucanase
MSGDGQGTDIELTDKLMNTLPTDNVPNRMMVEVHNYTPSQFTLLGDGDVSWGKMVYYWGAGHHSTIVPERNATFEEENEHIKYFDKLKASFVDKGIPLLMGEYGAYRRDVSAHVPKDLATHSASVDYWITFITKEVLPAA